MAMYHSWGSMNAWLRQIHGGNRLYMNLEPGEIAPYGETAPIGSIVLLDRADDVDPSLTPTDKAEALEDIILQNFARDVPRILDTLHSVVGDSECYRLTYARADQAVALLQDAFGAGGGAA